MLLVYFSPQRWCILFQWRQIIQLIFWSCMLNLILFCLLKYPLQYFYHTWLHFCPTKLIRSIIRNTFQLQIFVLSVPFPTSWRLLICIPLAGLPQDLLLCTPSSSALPKELWRKEDFLAQLSEFYTLYSKQPESSIYIFGSSAPCLFFDLLLPIPTGQGARCTSADSTWQRKKWWP